jgi:choline-sulfatase
MKKRNWVKIATTGVLALAAVGLFFALPLRARPEFRKPNILFIAADDLNDWVGAMGHPDIKTPNLDRLAKRGTIFTNAHCQSPLCSPSRMSLLTGLRPSTLGIYALEPWFRMSPRYKDWKTLPQYFSANGYETMSTGKVFHDAYPPQNRGEFDQPGRPGGWGPVPPQRLVNLPVRHPHIDWGPYPQDDKTQSDWKVADWAIERLKDPGKKPFFLSVGFRHPHVPLYASQRWFDLYPEDSVQLPPYLKYDRDDTPRFSWFLHWSVAEPRTRLLEEYDQWKPMVRAYMASVSFMDDQVGRVLNALKLSGQEQNTIIVFWSDNGYHLGEKGITGKNSLWEPSTHVPLIVAGPGVSRGARCDRPAELLDLYPTLIDLCKLPKHEQLEGHSLAPQLRSARAPRLWPAVTTQGPGNTAVRTERWRYIRYADGSQELYDRDNDPNEWTNLAWDPAYASQCREMAGWIPKLTRPPLPTSHTRLIEYRNGKPYWEGKPIVANAPVPMDQPWQYKRWLPPYGGRPGWGPKWTPDVAHRRVPWMPMGPGTPNGPPFGMGPRFPKHPWPALGPSSNAPKPSSQL